MLVALSGYLVLWAVFFMLLVFTFRKNIDSTLDSQQRWLGMYTSTFVGDLRTGNFLAIKRKIRTLLENDVFTQVDVRSGELHLYDSRPGAGEPMSMVENMLASLVPARDIELTIRDEYNTGWGTLMAKVDRRFLLRPLSRSIGIYTRVAAGCFFVLLGLLFILFQSQATPVAELTNYIEKFSSSAEKPEELQALLEKDVTFKIHEWSVLADSFKSSVRHIIALQDEVRNQKIEAELSKVAVQVAHDVRSPLAVISTVASLSDDLSNQKYKDLLKAAVHQLEVIANDLLSKYRKTKIPMLGTQGGEAAVPVDIIPDIEWAVGTAQMEYQGRSDVTVEREGGIVPDLPLIKLEQVGFRRVLLNLIHNGVDALTGPGRVAIRVAKAAGGVVVEVTDTGRGIAPDVVEKLMSSGGSHDKQGGHGLGLSHAIRSVKAWGGSLEIDSQVGKGTVVRIRLPSAFAENQTAFRIPVPRESVIVIVDDDPGIHAVWKERIRRVPGLRAAPIFAFFTEDELLQWRDSRGPMDSRAVFLMDYELTGSRKTGLELIEDLDAQSTAVLVTGKYDDPELRRKADSISVPIIPKTQLDKVSFLVA